MFFTAYVLKCIIVRMIVRYTASKLREDIYKILDKVLESGNSIEILRKGKTLRIIPDQKSSLFKRVKKRDWVVGGSEELMNLDWSDTWSEIKK